MKVKDYISAILKKINTPEMRILPGNIAFFFVLALIPIITMAVVVVSYFSVSMDIIVNFINSLVPSEVSDTIIDAVFTNGYDSSISIFNIIALFVASNGTYAIITAANTLYKVKEADQLKDRIKSFILLILLIGLIVFLIVVPMFGSRLLSLFGNGELVKDVRLVYSLAKWPLTIFLIYFTLKVIYTIAPGVKISSKDTTVGARFTTIIWTLITFVFGYYLKHFANYSAIYGSLSNLIILVIWLYVISYVFVIGLAINAYKSNDK